MKDQQARLCTMTATALDDSETSITYHYMLNQQIVNIKPRTSKRAIPSIAVVTKSANWIEREIHDLFRVHRRSDHESSY